MDYSDPGERYQKGITFDERINFAYDLEQEIDESKNELDDLIEQGRDETCSDDLSERINKNEIR